VGEKTTALEPFHPDRVASRILGMGDVLSLVEEVQSKVDRDKAQELVTKLRKGQGFDLADFRDQLQQMSSLGGMAGLMEKLPGMTQVPDHVKRQVNDKEVVKLVAIINSMTPQERTFPAVIKGARKRRIALGSGTQVQDVNRLLKQFTQMQKMMKKMKGGGMARMLRGLKGRAPGGMPPGGFPF
jgi:signal recognition particle subunit SRP54